MYQISGLKLKNCDRELPDIHLFIYFILFIQSPHRTPRDAVYQISGLSVKNCDREVPGGRTDRRTDIHTYRVPKQGKTGRNRNSSQGSVLVSGHYWFVKQCWLVNITGLYRVQVSENYRFLPQRFNYLIFCLCILGCTETQTWGW